MKQFVHDWIHLTQGEMFIKYWWLDLLTILITILLCFVVSSWHDNYLIKHRPKTLQERVDAQKAKDLRDKFRMWERHVEPYLIEQGFTVKVIKDYKRLYFSDSSVEFELAKAYKYRNTRGLPRIDSKSGKALWSNKVPPLPSELSPRRNLDRGAPTRPTKQ